MIRHLTRLSEHLRCVAYSKLPQQRAVECQERVLSRYGPVSISSFTSLPQAIEFLLPLKSFVRRFLILPCGELSFVCSDMIGEWCMVDVYAHSRMTRCEAVAGVALPVSRQFCYIADGAIHRKIGCDEDGDRWVFESTGEPLSFEDSARYLRRVKRERLTPEMVESLLFRLVGTSAPLSLSRSDVTVIGLERSWKDLRGQVEELNVENDIFPGVSAYQPIGGNQPASA